MSLNAGAFALGCGVCLSYSSGGSCQGQGCKDLLDEAPHQHQHVMLEVRSICEGVGADVFGRRQRVGCPENDCTERFLRDPESVHEILSKD